MNEINEYKPSKMLINGLVIVFLWMLMYSVACGMEIIGRVQNDIPYFNNSIALFPRLRAF